LIFAEIEAKLHHGAGTLESRVGSKEYELVISFSTSCGKNSINFVHNKGLLELLVGVLIYIFLATIFGN
jgi:hypothetical protein